MLLVFDLLHHRADTNLRVDYYCSKWAWDSPCKPFSKESVARFKDGMRKVRLWPEDLADVNIFTSMLTEMRSRYAVCMG
jgi:hypothetical protein